MAADTILYWIIIFLGCFLGILFVLFLISNIMRESPGDEKMTEIAEIIRRGAKLYLKKEYLVLIPITIVIAFFIGFLIPPQPYVGIGYLIGTFFSALAAWIGVSTATFANSRTAEASKKSWKNGFRVAYSSGAVMGFSVVGFGLLSLALISLIWSDNKVWLGFAFGSSIVAFFLRVGGGIFTKSADIGADLVGKIEQGIPEDDIRNPAVIADNVGDNVGDIAGMGSDLHESYVSTIAAAMVLGLSSQFFTGNNGMFLPLILASLGILISIFGVFFVVPKAKHEDTFQEQVKKTHKAMNRGVAISNLIMVLVSFIIILLFTGSLELSVPIFGALITGLITGFVLSIFIEYYTSANHKPTQSIAKSSEAGPAINIIEGMGTGLLSVGLPVLLVVTATLISYSLVGLFGIAIGALGMMVNLGIVLSMDCYGPIADNAAGIAEMSDLGQDIRERCEALDAVGNTTAALGKGFAIGSAALAALSWLAVYLEVVKLEPSLLAIDRIDIITGMFIGSGMIFVLSALRMKSVSKGAFKMVNEVRRQFNEIDGIMEKTAKPDYDRCVDIATKISLESMLIPGILVVIIPLILGFTFGPGSVAGLLLGSLITGFIFALMMSNSGSAWDNAKKYIEAGHYGGKGTEAHHASIVGDTVGDPFKDAVGPAQDIFIKLVGKIGVLFGPLFLLFMIA